LETRRIRRKTQQPKGIKRKNLKPSRDRSSKPKN
jgi:hypothetical protein